jgi:hypothetical protein
MVSLHGVHLLSVDLCAAGWHRLCPYLLQTTLAPTFTCCAPALLLPTLQEQVGLFLAGLISFNLVASLLPSSATFKQQQQPQQPTSEVAGPLQDPTITLLDGPKKFFGVTNWGFTPQNELFAGRLAALGIAAAIVGELVTGLGPVGQLSAGEGGEVVIPGMLLVSVSPAWLLKVAVMLAVDSMHNSSFQLTAVGASLTISSFTLW